MILGLTYYFQPRMVIRIPSRLRIIIPNRIIEGGLIIEIDTTPLLPILAFSRKRLLFRVVFFMLVKFLNQNNF